MSIVLVKRDGLATIHASSNTARALRSYDRQLADTEVVDGVAVADWPDGVHVVKQLPPEPE